MTARNLLVLLVATTTAGSAQSQNLNDYRIDFSKVAIRNDDTMDHVAQLKTKLEALRGKLSRSADDLLTALQTRDEVLAILDRRHFISHLHYLLDTKFPPNADSNEPDQEEYGGFIDSEIAAIPDAQLARFTAEKPGLAKYAYVIAQVKRDKLHRLSDKEEASLSKLNPDYQQWESRAFETLQSDLPTGEVSRSLHATALIQLSESLNAEAKLRGFKDSVDRYCFDINLETSKVDSLVANLRRNGHLLDELSKLRKAHLSQEPKVPPHFTLQEATQKVVQALAPLGPEYGAEMSALLDPENGRLDAAGGPNRSGLGTGWSAPGMTSILYWPNFTGVYDDLDRGLSHEGGHAIHYELMVKNGVPEAYYAGPGYLYESYAELNQLLLADYFYKNESDPQKKLFYLLQLLDKAEYPLYLAQYPDEEYAFHRAVAAGKIHDAAGLDRLENSVLSRWPGVSRRPGSPRWMTNERFYSVPLYTINHLLGSILAIAYFVQLEKDPSGFVPKYIGLLSQGFHDSPETLLKASLDIDLNDPALVTECMEFLRERTVELKRLYKQVGERAPLLQSRSKP
ncbi:MAG TPA: hypothetical protein VG944_22590 [Fimbriimonas sp.]|nr:hypothetical protein [Fimbriimonas sp.]